MNLFTITVDGETVTLQPPVALVPTADGDVQISYRDLGGYDADTLARFGITKTEVADPPAPTVRAQLPKSTVVARVNAVGKLGAVFAALNAQPLAFAQWFAPDWPNVYVDDAGMLAILQAAGLTADEIAQVTAVA